MEDIINNAIKSNKTCYFISPHLDDAAFSCGGLINHLSGKTKVVVITIFTSAGKTNHTLSAIRYAQMCGYGRREIMRFYKDRRKEDRELWHSIGVKFVHLGFKDALWRPKRGMSWLERILSILINEPRYIYPTHRLHVAKGVISKHDVVNIKKIENKILKITGRSKNKLVFCPVGLGGHVDHIITRSVCKKIFDEPIYWEDSPYNIYHKHTDNFVKQNDLKKHALIIDQKARHAMYPAYKTQFGKLFDGERKFKLPPEIYFLRFNS